MDNGHTEALCGSRNDQPGGSLTRSWDEVTCGDCKAERGALKPRYQADYHAPAPAATQDAAASAVVGRDADLARIAKIIEDNYDAPRGENINSHALAAMILADLDVEWGRNPAAPDVRERTCVTMGHENVSATVLGFYDDGNEQIADVAYCAECSATMVKGGEYTVTSVLAPSATSVDEQVQRECSRRCGRWGETMYHAEECPNREPAEAVSIPAICDAYREVGGDIVCRGKVIADVLPGPSAPATGATATPWRMTDDEAVRVHKRVKRLRVWGVREAVAAAVEEGVVSAPPR